MRVLGALFLSALFVIEVSAAPRRRSASQGGARAACGVLSPSSVSLTAFGTANGCDARTGTGCDRLQPIEFAVGNPQYDFSCAPHTIVWDFGDGTSMSASAQTRVRHTYAEPGSFLVTADIRREGFPSVVVQQLIKVFEVPYACGPMTEASVFISVRGSMTGCTTVSGMCGVNEDIQLSVQGFRYNFACSPHTVVWTFGDGTAAVTATPGTPVRHRFTTAGTFAVSATITNERQRHVTTYPLRIGHIAIP